MPRPRSEDRRIAILSAATRVIAAQGLGAATATIAKEASVSNGSLFLYFETKAILINELYIDLKGEMGAAAIAGLPAKGSPREQILHLWSQWLHWATINPEKRRALAHLEVAPVITADSHQKASHAFKGIADLLERCRADGPMQDAPLSFVLTLTSAIADATTDLIICEPDRAELHSRLAFDAIWHVLAGSPFPSTTKPQPPPKESK